MIKNLSISDLELIKKRLDYQRTKIWYEKKTEEEFKNSPETISIENLIAEIEAEINLRIEKLK